MFLIPDITQEQVETPINRYCFSGHFAPELYRRNGSDSPQEPIRFFSVKSNNINGIYCEICLVIANYLAKLKKDK